jgi:hypothetical protein
MISHLFVFHAEVVPDVARQLVSVCIADNCYTVTAIVGALTEGATDAIKYCFTGQLEAHCAPAGWGHSAAANLSAAPEDHPGRKRTRFAAVHSEF